MIPRDPFPSPLATRNRLNLSTSRIAERLPFHIMVEILAEVETFDHDGSLDHGGELVRWNSHENLVPMTLVCRAWTDAASHILFGSVALFGGAAAASFLRSLEVRPMRAALVRSLVIGLRCEEEASEIEGYQLSESLLLIKALEACPRLRHLQVRDSRHRGDSDLTGCDGRCDLSTLE